MIDLTSLQSKHLSAAIKGYTHDNSILFPLVGALAAAIENGCRFVGAADLDLLEKGALTATPDRSVRALN